MWRGEGVADLFVGGPKVKALQVFGPFYVVCSRLTCGVPADKQQRSLDLDYLTLLNQAQTPLFQQFDDQQV